MHIDVQTLQIAITARRHVSDCGCIRVPLDDDDEDDNKSKIFKTIVLTFELFNKEHKS